MFTAVADTNIYVSAFNFKGIPARVLELAQNGYFRIAISDEILTEINRILGEKFNWQPARVAQYGPRFWDSPSWWNPRRRLMQLLPTLTTMQFSNARSKRVRDI